MKLEYIIQVSSRKSRRQKKKNNRYHHNKMETPITNTAWTLYQITRFSQIGQCNNPFIVVAFKLWQNRFIFSRISNEKTTQHQGSNCRKWKKIYEKYKKGSAKSWALITRVNICSIYEWHWIFHGTFSNNRCKNITLLCNLFHMKHHSTSYVRFDDFHLFTNNEAFSQYTWENAVWLKLRKRVLVENTIEKQVLNGLSDMNFAEQKRVLQLNRVFKMKSF